MKKIYKLSSILIVLLLVNCGYTPIYTVKSINFKIDRIEFSGDKKLKYKLQNKLKRYKKIKNSENTLTLEINSEKKITTQSKNSKGEALFYLMEIKINITSTNQNNIIKKNNFIESFTYNNKADKFDLSQYEKNIEENLIDTIINKIIIDLSTKYQ
jgi:hypothetical protein